MNTPDFAICIFWKLRLLFVCTLKRAKNWKKRKEILKIIFLHDSFEIVSKGRNRIGINKKAQDFKEEDYISLMIIR